MSTAKPARCTMPSFSGGIGFPRTASSRRKRSLPPSKQGCKTQESQDHRRRPVGSCLLIGVIDDLHDTNRSRHIVLGEVAAEDQSDGFIGRLEPVGRLIKAVLEDLERVALEVLACTPDSDVVAVVLLIVAGNQVQRLPLAVPLDRDGQRFTVVHHGDQGHFSVDVNGLTVDLPDHIPLLQAGLHGGGIRNDFLDYRQVCSDKSHQNDGKNKAEDKIGNGTRCHSCDPASYRGIGEGVLIQFSPFLILQSVQSVKHAGAADGEQTDAQICPWQASSTSSRRSMAAWLR